MLPVLAEYRDMFRPDPRATYDKIISIDLNTIAPRVNGPFTPDVSNTIGENLAKACKMEDWPLQLSSGLIGSCTNSSYEDMKRCAQLVNKATEAGLRFPIPFYVTPGSKTIQKTLEEEGIMKSFEEAGAIILANACGPCIGQWDRNIVAETKNSIITSYNRNFAKRNDGNPCTHTFIASPETATMLAFAGRLDHGVKPRLKPRVEKDFHASQPRVGPRRRLLGGRVTLERFLNSGCNHEASRCVCVCV